MHCFLFFQIVFEGIVGSGYEGDISIDDIWISSGPCAAFGSCAFEQDLCGWTPSEQENDFDWYRLSSKQISLLYNGTNYPSRDTTVNNAYGHFLWAASDFRSNLGNQSAYLYSEILLAYQYQNGACLTFSYFIKGPSILNVYAQERATGENTSLLWTVEQDQGNQWLEGQVDISVVDHDLEVNSSNEFLG